MNTNRIRKKKQDKNICMRSYCTNNENKTKHFTCSPHAFIEDACMFVCTAQHMADSFHFYTNGNNENRKFYGVCFSIGLHGMGKSEIHRVKLTSANIRSTFSFSNTKQHKSNKLNIRSFQISHMCISSCYCRCYFHCSILLCPFNSF